MDNPTLKYNASTKSWDPVTIRARLTITGRADLEAPALNPDFIVEDHPDSGTPGIGSKIIKISSRTLINDGKAVQFVVSVDTPRADILRQQQGFALKVTAKPLQISASGIPAPNDAIGAIMVFLEVPPDCIDVKPPESPLLIDASMGKSVALTATCQAFDFAKREMAPNPTAKLKYTLQPGPGFDLLTMKQEPKAGGNLTFDLGIKRFVIGNGMKPQLCKLTFEWESGSTMMGEPSPAKVSVECTSEPVFCDCHVLMTDAQRRTTEVYRTKISAEADILKLSVECENKEFKWEGVTLVVMVRNASPFYLKSHVEEARFDLKGPCTGADALTVQLIRQLDKFSGTCEGRIVFPNPEKEGFRGLLTIAKPGWESYSVHVTELIGADAEKQLQEKDLRVEVTGSFVSRDGTVSVGDSDVIFVEDFSAAFRASEEEPWSGAYDKKERAFILTNPKRPPNKPDPSPVKVSIKLRLEADLYRTIDKTCSDSLELDPSLTGPLTTYVRNFVRLLAEITAHQVLDSLRGIYHKALGMSEYAVQSKVLTKYLDLAFDLRAKVAQQCINNCIGFLIEVGFYYKSWGGSGISELQENQTKRIVLNRSKEVCEQSANYLKGQVDELGNAMVELNTRIGGLMAKQETLTKEIGEAISKGLSDSAGKLTEEATRVAEQIARLNTDFINLRQTHQAFESALEAAKAALPATAELAQEALKELQGKIGSLSAAASDTYKKILSTVFEQDYRQYSQCAREYADKKPKVAADLPAQHTFVQTTGDKDYSLASAIYEDAVRLLKYLVTELTNGIRVIFNYLSHIVRECMYTNHQIVPEHLDRYADYCLSRSDLDVQHLNTASLQKTLDILTGRRLASRMSEAAYAPSQADKESQNNQWTELDNQNRMKIRNALVLMLRKALSEKELLSLSYSDFQKACEASGGLTKRIREYFAAFEDVEKSYYDQFNQFILGNGDREVNYQHLQNLIDWWLWTMAWSARIAESLLFMLGITAPAAIGMAKAADALDVANASIKLALSVLGQLPDVTGIIEAVPLLSSMMLRTLTEQGVALGDAILD